VVAIAAADGKARDIEVLCRIDTEEELLYYRHGGILPFVLRNLASAA
jgi:aconitate hydratase